MTYRNPGVLARQALTVAEISGGRLELGIGSGASAYDHEATQVPEWAPKERAAAFVAWTERLVEMLAFERYDPKHDIRLTIAGRGPTILGLAARYAYRWNTFGGFGVSRRKPWSPRPRTTRDSTSCAQRRAARSSRSILLGWHGFIPETPWRSDQAFAEVLERWRAAGFDEAVFYYPPDRHARGSVRRACSNALSQRQARRGARSEVPAAGAERRGSGRGVEVAHMAPREASQQGTPQDAVAGQEEGRASPKGHHHPELIGLGLAGFGLFMASVLYAGWNGGDIGQAIGDGLVALIGGTAYVLPIAARRSAR